ncbi:helix-turn-helix domain-containing protein [Arthrobacter sp.]|uniref:helix-turn-helix domain-containing protein n=1 Tax=Arthrobacter sp. TaxID=1667 RepID=UPI003397DDA4
MSTGFPSATLDFGRGAVEATRSSPATATRFSTLNVPRDERLPLWEEYNKRSLIGLHCRTLAANSLLAAQRNLQLNRVRFTEIKGNDHVVERSLRDIRSTPADNILLCLLSEGNAFYYHSGGAETLAAGDAVLYDADQPFMYGFSTDMRQVILEIPRSAYLERTGSPGLAGPQVLRAGGSLAGSHAQALVGIIRNALTAPPADVQPVEDAALDLFDRIVGAKSGSTGAYLLAAKEFVRRHLREPDLSAARIARAVGISERHLGRIFAAEETTIARFVMESRLQRARDMLTAESNNSIPVSTVAESLGFVSAAHFSRSFKQAFGHTPREARAQGAAAN